MNRFKIDLKVDGEGFEPVIPFDCKKDIRSFIYNSIGFKNSQFGNWLHDSGYRKSNLRYYNNEFFNNYKLFTFSDLCFHEYETTKEGFLIKNKPIVNLHVSFYPDDFNEIKSKEIFNKKTFIIENNNNKIKFTVDKIRKWETSEFKNEMNFETISPIVLSKKNEENGKNKIYLNPKKDKEYSDILIKNILNKYESYHKEKFQFENNSIQFKLNDVDNYKEKLIVTKEKENKKIFVKAYKYKFKLIAPKEIMEIAYFAGVGENNASGFGSIKTINN